MKRRFFFDRIEHLEALVADPSTPQSCLEEIARELTFRSTFRARDLAKKLKRRNGNLPLPEQEADQGSVVSGALAVRVSTLPLSVRAQHALATLNATTVGDLCRLSVRCSQIGGRSLSTPLRNDQVALVALLVLGGDRAPVDTENVAIEADKLAPGRFRWRKFKEHIDLGLVRNGLQDARKKQLVDGGAHRGWVLTPNGMKEASRLLPGIADPSTRKRVSTEQRQWEARERSRLLAEPAFLIALEKGATVLTKRDALRLFKLDEYTSPDRRSERLRRFALSFTDEPELGRVVGELIRRIEDEQA